jgi:probable O-glycosylation ligase (exosortase A-associated)
MRDIALTLFVFSMVPVALWRPWIGMLTWTWIGLMNPHRLTWSFAHDMPFAQIMGIATFVGFLISKEPKRFPVNAVTVVLLIFIAWMCLTTLFAFIPDNATDQLSKVLKVQAGILLSLFLLQSRERIQWLVWVIVVSIGYYGVKGGYFTLRGGGVEKVLGPEGSFIAGNTEIGLALVMLLPLMRYLQVMSERRWVRLGLLVAMILTGIAVLGTQSRGAFVAVGAMVAFLWLKSEKKLVPGIVIATAAALTLMFMPDSWWAKMATMLEYEKDGSAMGRINAWMFAINLAMSRPIVGGGFNAFTPSLFQIYAPNPASFADAHSIYFEVLGEHGFIGLALFLLLAVLTWRTGSRLIRLARAPEHAWARNLGAMAQVSLIGYWAGGAFLGLAYFDGYYVIISLLVLARAVLEHEVLAQAVTPDVPLTTSQATAAANSSHRS